MCTFCISFVIPFAETAGAQESPPDDDDDDDDGGGGGDRLEAVEQRQQKRGSRLPVSLFFFPLANLVRHSRTKKPNRDGALSNF